MKPLVTTFGLVLLMGSVTAYADCLRCESNVVCPGDSTADLILKCGQPDYQEEAAYSTTGSISGSRRGSASVDVTTQKVENWFYNCGEGRFLRVVEVTRGKITSIKTAGTRGKGPVKCE